MVSVSFIYTLYILILSHIDISPSGLGIQHLLLSGPPHFPLTKFPPSHPSLNHLQSPSALSHSASAPAGKCYINLLLKL